MPETSASTVEQRVHALVEQHRVELERLVDQELDRTLEVLIAERIVARNGRDVHKNVILCATCGERERAPGRTVCSRCKERERRARKAAKDDVPRTGSIAQPD